MAAMAMRLPRGNYRGNLNGDEIVFGRRLTRTLAEYGVSKLYLSEEQKSRFGNIYGFVAAFLERHSNDDLEAEVKGGRMKIPRVLIDYADIKPNNITILGRPTGSPRLEIWNGEEIDYVVSRLQSSQRSEEALNSLKRSGLK